MVIMGGSTIYPSWVMSGWRMAYLSSFRLVASTGISIVTVSEFKCLYFEVWVGCARWFICSWGSYDAYYIKSKSSWPFTFW